MMRMPAEWEAQESVWLAWPRDPQTWPDRLDRAREAYLGILGALTRTGRVDLLVTPEDHDAAVSAITGSLGPLAERVALHSVAYQDSWVRDYGPTYRIDDQGGRDAIKWTFDAWGGKYESLKDDDAVVDRLDPQAWRVDGLQRTGLVLEGGAIDVDGQGTLLTTRACLLDAGRNPGMDQEALEARLGDLLGIEHTIWLQDGITGDDTDGHVDDVARFVAPGHVVCCEADKDHPDHEILEENLAILRSSMTARGERVRVTTLPMPEPVRTDEDQLLPASHANFLLSNGRLLLPTFGGDSDRVAAKRLGQACPGQQVVPIDSTDLIWGMGSVHCLSQQVPARWAGRAPRS